MSLTEIIDYYGYLALVVGTFLEGETIVVLAGFAAHRGYLSLPWVMLAAFAGSFLGDQLYFHLGRRKGEAFLRRRVTWAPRVERVRSLIERHQIPFILGFRFVYGIRTVSPFAIGVSDVPTRRYLVLNLIGAAVWAAAVAYLGYTLGEAAEALLGQLHRYELGIFAAIAAVGTILWGIRFSRRRRQRSVSCAPSLWKERLAGLAASDNQEDVKSRGEVGKTGGFPPIVVEALEAPRRLAGSAPGENAGDPS